VLPGRYRLYFDLQGNDQKDGERYFYPGMIKPEEAEVINLRFGEKLDGYDFTLPQEFRSGDCKAKYSGLMQVRLQG